MSDANGQAGSPIAELTEIADRDPAWTELAAELSALLAQPEKQIGAEHLARVDALVRSIEARPAQSPRATLEQLLKIVDARRARPEEHANALRDTRATLDAAKAELRSRVPHASARVRSRIGKGPMRHIPTGFPSLDKITRGGLISGRSHTIGGAPDTGKTSFVVQMGHRMAAARYVVAIHCADEEREGIEMRIGQSIGLALEDLEARNPAALEYLASHLETLPLLIIDQDEDESTIEQTAASLIEFAKSVPDCLGLVLIGDSLQTIRAAGTEDARTPKDRIDAVVNAVRTLTKTTGITAIVTSEVARGAYSPRKASDRINPIAAFKESGSIEYVANTAMFLSRVKGEEDLINVAVPKNKRGAGNDAFRLRRDWRRCTYVDEGFARVDESEAPEQRNPGASPTGPAPWLEGAIVKARETLVRNPGVGGRDAWMALIGGKAVRARAAMQRLVDLEEVEERTVSGKKKLYWRDPRPGR